MVKIQELCRIFSLPEYKLDYIKAKATGTCLICKNPVEAFPEGLTRLEYNVSAICQNCQDEYISREGNIS